MDTNDIKLITENIFKLVKENKNYLLDSFNFIPPLILKTSFSVGTTWQIRGQ